MSRISGRVPLLYNHVDSSIHKTVIALDRDALDPRAREKLSPQIEEGECGWVTRLWAWGDHEGRLVMGNCRRSPEPSLSSSSASASRGSHPPPVMLFIVDRGNGPWALGEAGGGRHTVRHRAAVRMITDQVTVDRAAPSVKGGGWARCHVIT